MLSACRSWSGWRSLVHLLVVIPTVHAQGDAGQQASFAALVIGLSIVALIVILAVGCSLRRRPPVVEAAEDNEVEAGKPPCVACGNSGCGLCSPSEVQVERGVKASEPEIATDDFQVEVAFEPPEDEPIDQGNKSSPCIFSQPPVRFVFQTPSKICAGRVEHL